MWGTNAGLIIGGRTGGTGTDKSQTVNAKELTRDTCLLMAR